MQKPHNFLVHTKSRTIFPFLAALSLILGTGCSSEEAVLYSATYFGFETFITIKAINSGQTIVDEVGERLSAFSDLCDRFSDTSAVTIYDVNETNEPIEVPKDLFDCLAFAIDMQKECGSYFNPLIANLSDLWKDSIADPNHELPDEDAILAAIEEMNASDLELDETTCKVTRVGTAKVDMGAFAKGYALTFAKKMFEEAGVERYIINAGNSSLLVGKSSTYGTYKIIPEVDDKHYFAVMESSIGTSGSETQEFEKDGVAYTHIVNPSTGSAKVQPYPFVSVMVDDPGIADVLSTVLYLMGPGEEAKSLADHYDANYAFYDGDGAWDTYGLSVIDR